jgi:hypothetical protein
LFRGERGLTCSKKQEVREAIAYYKNRCFDKDSFSLMHKICVALQKNALSFYLRAMNAVAIVSC